MSAFDAVQSSDDDAETPGTGPVGGAPAGAGFAAMDVDRDERAAALPREPLSPDVPPVSGAPVAAGSAPAAAARADDAGGRPAAAGPMGTPGPAGAASGGSASADSRTPPSRFRPPAGLQGLSLGGLCSPAGPPPGLGYASGDSGIGSGRPMPLMMPPRSGTETSVGGRECRSRQSSTLESPHGAMSCRSERKARFLRNSGLQGLLPVEKCSDGGCKLPGGHRDAGDLFATELLPWLWLGGEHDAVREEELRRRRISHIVNLTPESKVPCRPGIEYLCVQVNDHSDAPIRTHFDRVFAWIDAARESGGSLLIHCRQGVSRSATVSIGYFMSRLHVPYRLAHDVVKRRRPAINPNLGFVTCLEEYEADLGLDPSRPLSEFRGALARWNLCSPLLDDDYCEEDRDDPPSPKTTGALLTFS